MLYTYVPHSDILMAAKREFSRSPIVDAKFKSLRIEKVKFRKDGTAAKVPSIFYSCEHCTQEFKREEMQCDHKEPVVPLEIPAKHMHWEMMIEQRCFVQTLGQLQLLCKPCHRLKTNDETRLRKEWRQKEKHMVIVTYDTTTWKSYLDYHSCVDINDGYIGSNPELLQSFKTHGYSKFIRKVMFCFDNEIQAMNKLKELTA